MNKKRFTRINSCTSKTIKGIFSENIACFFLESKGWEIIARNWRTRSGELDIVALKKTELVFVEVKCIDAFGMESISWTIGPRKQKRIAETAQYFLIHNRQYEGMSIHFDVILVNQNLECTHLEHAFMDYSL